MALPNICGTLTAGQNFACENVVSRFAQQIVLINYVDIATKTINTETVAETCNHNVTFALKTGKKGFRFTLSDNASAISGTFEKSSNDYGVPLFKHIVNMAVGGASESAKCILEKLSKGRYVVALQIGDIIEIYGIQNGLSAGDFTSDLQGNSGYIPLTLESLENSLESNVPLVYKSAEAGSEVEDFDADFSAAKAEAAKLYATAEDNLLRVQLEAYADGQITFEEQQRIIQMKDNLAAAKTYADAQDDLEKIAANAYADGVIDKEEARAIADATAKMEAAKLHAHDLVNNIEMGGRNLILNSKSLEGISDSYGGLTDAVMPLSVKLEKDKEYIFTYKNNNDIPRAEINTITLRNANSETIQEIQTIGDGSETIFKVNVDGVIGIAFYSIWKNGLFSFRELMLTSGNKIVDWTPSPEDVDATA